MPVTSSRTSEGDNSTGPSKILWTLWMAGGGLVVGVLVYMATTSIVWTVVAVFGSGVVLNAIGQMVTQPVKAARSRNHGDERAGHRP
jgi:hypothetical protein